MSNNLIPVQRPDKNGVMVTRWVKPDYKSSLARSVPAPNVNMDVRSELHQTLVGSVDASISDQGINKNEVLKKVLRLPVKTADALLNLHKSERDLYAVECIIVCALHHNETPDTLENIALVYNEYQYTELDWEYQNHGAYNYIIGNVRGLSQYPQYAGITNFNNHGDEIKNQAKLLTKLVFEGERYSGVMQETITPEGGAYHFSNPEFVQLVIDNAGTEEQGGDFHDLVYDKGCDPDILKELLGTTTPLRSGVL
jgi:hypothetical protein